MTDKALCYVIISMLEHLVIFYKTQREGRYDLLDKPLSFVDLFE